MEKLDLKFKKNDVLTSVAMNNIVGKINEIVLNGSVQFAVGRCIKPTSRIGNLYYFAEEVNLHPNFAALEGFEEFVERYDVTIHPQIGSQGGYNRISLLDYGKGTIVEIVDTPHCRDLSWMRVYLPRRVQQGWTIKNLSSPYLEVHNGKVVCVSTNFGIPIWYKPIMARRKKTNGKNDRNWKLRNIRHSRHKPPTIYSLEWYQNGRLLPLNPKVKIGQWRMRFMVRNKISIFYTDFRVLKNHGKKQYIYKE